MFFQGKSGTFLRSVRATGRNAVNMVAIKDAGWDYVMIPVHDAQIGLDGVQYPPYFITPWVPVMNRCEEIGLPYVPWARVWKDANMPRLRDAAEVMADRQGWTRPAGVWNVEKELESGDTTLGAINATSKGCDCVVSTEAGPLAVPWSTLRADAIVELQLFTMIPGGWSSDPRSARAKFYEVGLQADTRFQFSAREQGKVGVRDDYPYAERGMFVLYTADDIHPAYGSWAPLPGLPAVAEAKFPYLGAMYGPSSFRFDKQALSGAQRSQIKQIKIALHRAGYGTFAKPDGAFNRPLENALARMQRHYGILATGQYGRASWDRLRRLPSANKVSTDRALGLGAHALTV